MGRMRNSVRAGGTGRTASGRSNRTRRQSGSPTRSSSGSGESVAARLLPLYIGRTVGAPSFQADGANAAARRSPRASRRTASRPVRSGNLSPPAPSGAGFKPKETTTRSASRPSSTTGRFLQDHAPTHNEHPCPGYRTLRSACLPAGRLASDSPPRASRYRVVRGRARRAATGRVRPRPSALCPGMRALHVRARCLRSGSLRRSSHCGSRSAPSRVAAPAQHGRSSRSAFPLDRALCGRRVASVAERTSAAGRHY